MISRGFASRGTCQEKIYISQGWVWVKVRRKLKDRAEVWVQARKHELKVKRRVHVLTGGRHEVKNLKTGLRVQGICDSHRKGKEKAKLNRKMAPICQGCRADFCMIREVMALGNQERNIDPLMSLLFFKLWPTEHKCIANQFNPVILVQLCSFTWCVLDSNARPTLESVWPGAQAGAKAPTSEAYWPGRGTPLMAFWHQVQLQ